MYISSLCELHIPVHVIYQCNKIVSKLILLISLPILIECVETCIHVKILLRVVLIKPICSNRHIATGNTHFHHLRLCTAPTNAGRYRVFYLTESPDLHISAANTKKITTLLKITPTAIDLRNSRV